MLNRVLLTFSVIFGLCVIISKAKVLASSEVDVVTKIMKEIPPVIAADENQIIAALDMGRGHLYKRRKNFKQIYPVLLASLVAKIFVVSLILKLLIAAISSAFVMSKIALVTSAIMALGWFFGITGEKAKLQIVQYPLSGSKKSYGGWNVNYAATPQYNDWPYDNNGWNDDKEKNVFL